MPDKQFSLEEYHRKVERCDSKFDLFHECVSKHGWNDNQCQSVIKPKYDRCIAKRVSTHLILAEVHGGWLFRPPRSPLPQCLVSRCRVGRRLTLAGYRTE